jgi:hypothetical protein
MLVGTEQLFAWMGWEEAPPLLFELLEGACSRKLREAV